MVPDSIIKWQLGPILHSSFLQRRLQQGKPWVKEAPTRCSCVSKSLVGNWGSTGFWHQAPAPLVGSLPGFALLFTLLQGNLQSVWSARKFLQLAFIHAY